MKQQFTKEDIIRDLYNESDYLEKMAIQKARKEDFEFGEDYKTIQKSKDLLSSVELAPPAFLIQNILDYSASSKFEPNIG